MCSAQKMVAYSSQVTPYHEVYHESVWGHMDPDRLSVPRHVQSSGELDSPLTDVRTDTKTSFELLFGSFSYSPIHKRFANPSTSSPTSISGRWYST